MALKLDKRALTGYLKLTCEYELDILPNRKVSAAKDYGENYIKVRLSPVRHLLHNRLQTWHVHFRFLPVC